MKFLNVIFFYLTMTSTLAFAAGQPYGGNVNLKGMGGQSVDIENGNVNVKGMHGESVQTGGGSMNASGMSGQSASIKGNTGRNKSRDDEEEKEEKEDKE